MPPMPIGRTKSKKMSSGAICASGSAAPRIGSGMYWPSQPKSGTSTRNETNEPARMIAA